MVFHKFFLKFHTNFFIFARKSPLDSHRFSQCFTESHCCTQIITYFFFFFIFGDQNVFHKNSRFFMVFYKFSVLFMTVHINFILSFQRKNRSSMQIIAGNFFLMRGDLNFHGNSGSFAIFFQLLHNF